MPIVDMGMRFYRAEMRKRVRKQRRKGNQFKDELLSCYHNGRLRLGSTEPSKEIQN